MNVPTQYRPHLTPKFSIDDFLSIFRYNHYVILTVPLYMGQTLPIVHRLLLYAPTDQGEVYTIALYAGTLKAKRAHGQRPWFYCRNKIGI